MRIRSNGNYSKGNSEDSKGMGKDGMSYLR